MTAECANSAPTTFFWYRTALDITDSIEETGQLNLPLTCCLLAAWTVVCLGMFKGIKTSAKVRPRRPRKTTDKEVTSCGGLFSFRWSGWFPVVVQ